MATGSKLLALPKRRSESTKITNTVVWRAKARLGEYYIRDSELKGFYLRVKPSGIKTFGVRSRLNRRGRLMHRTIGPPALFNAKQAREIAKEWLQNIAAGLDPKHPGNGLRTPLEVLEEYIGAKDLAPRTTKDYRYNFEHYLKNLAKRPIQELTTEQIVNWYGKGKEHKVGTERAFVTLKTILSFAQALGYIKENPATKAALLVTRKASRTSQEHLSEIYSQLPAFMTAFIDADISEVMRDWIVLSLTTGLRREESMTIQWTQVDLDKKVITITKTKSKRFLLVPLSGLTYDMLQKRSNDPTKDARFVFTNKPETPIKDARKALRKICDTAGIKTINHHDLRRLFASVCEELNFSEEQIGKLLNHASRSVTDTYIHRSLENVRGKYQIVTDYLDRLVGSDDNPDARFTNLMRSCFYGKVEPSGYIPEPEEKLRWAHEEAAYWEGA